MILAIGYIGVGLLLVYLEGHDAGKRKRNRKMVGVPCGHENCAIDHVIAASEVTPRDEAYV